MNDRETSDHFEASVRKIATYRAVHGMSAIQNELKVDEE